MEQLERYMHTLCIFKGLRAIYIDCKRINTLCYCIFPSTLPVIPLGDLLYLAGHVCCAMLYTYAYSHLSSFSFSYVYVFLLCVRVCVCVHL